MSALSFATTKAFFSRKKLWTFHALIWYFVAPVLQSQRKCTCPREFAGYTDSILGTGLNCNHQGNHFVAFLMLV